MTTKSISSENAVSRTIKTGFSLFAASILILLNLICYRHTFAGYFLADDYVHVAYLADVFNGHPLRLLDNFTSNWMQAWGTQFYRPFISLTLAWDYFLGRGDALAFHLSNTAYHCASSIFLFLVVRRLLLEFSGKQQYICALAASILFAVCPLHTEVVSWIIGRVDGVCLAFYLAAFYFHLRHSQDSDRASLVLSIVCFIISLLSKEMAVTLPPLIVLTVLMFSKESNWKKRIVASIRESAVYWGVFVLYFGVRTLALGTSVGGYGGSVGEGLSGSMLERFKSAVKIIFPFNAEVISPYDRLAKQLLALYRLGAVFTAAKLLLLGNIKRQLKVIVFCIGWFVLSLAPTYQVFNITDSLMCSRFAYFATAPFCLLLAVLISPLWEIQRGNRKLVATWLERLSYVLIISAAVVFTNITIKNNSSWAHAGTQVREFRQALADACRILPGDRKLVLLNAPQRLEGAHMIYNGAMLQVLLSEPLSRPPLANRVLSFEPPTYGESDFINASRLRRLLDKSPENLYCYWDMAGKRLINLRLETEPVDFKYDLSKIDTGALIIDSPAMELDPLSCDFVKCTVGGSPSAGILTLSWASKNFPDFSPLRSISLPLPAGERRLAFPVSEHKSWIAGEKITRLRLEYTPQSKDNEVPKFSAVEIKSGKTELPELTAVPGQLAEGRDGIDRMASSHLEVSVDCSKIPACSQIALELSKPNSWFEHYAGTYRERKFSDQNLKRLFHEGNKAIFAFDRKDFPQPAYYELRAFALDDKGKIIGYSSDPLNLQID